MLIAMGWRHGKLVARGFEDSKEAILMFCVKAEIMSVMCICTDLGEIVYEKGEIVSLGLGMGVKYNRKGE